MTGTATSRSARRRTLAAVALCAFAYLYVFPSQPPINNPNENVRFYMTAAIVEFGTYEISDIRSRWGWTNDAAEYEGRFYSVKAPATSLLGVPAYAIYYYGCELFDAELDRHTALWVCRVGASILPTLLFLYFFHGWLGRQTRHGVVRDAVFLSVALGSLLFGYALIFVSHTLSAVVAFGAFMILYDARRREPTARQAFIAGVLTASVTLFEYPGLVVSVALTVYALIALRPYSRILVFGLGALIPTLIMMHFQWAAFDSPFTPGHIYVETDAWREAHHEGLYGATEFHFEAAAWLLFDRGGGLLPMTPVFALAAIGFPLLLRRKKTRLDAAVALACFLLTYVVICFMGNWRGGWTLGPRYLAVIVPFVAWAALAALDRMADRVPAVTGTVAVGAAGAALLASGLLSVYYPHLPEELTQPLPQLMPMLMAHDFAPYNAGNLLDWTGTASMLPFYLCLGATLPWALLRPGQGWRKQLSMGLGAVLVGALLALPSVTLSDKSADPTVSNRAKASVGWIARHWRPEGHDLAARLERHIAESSQVTPDDYRRLADIYLEEGREDEARRTIQRGNAASRRQRLRADSDPR